MKQANNSARHARSALFATLFFVAAAPAHADPNKVAAGKRRLEQAAQRHGAKHYFRDINGARRLYINASGANIRKISQVAQKNNVIQICHIDPHDLGKPGHQHTLTLFDGKAPHFQYRQRTSPGSWRLNDWGPFRGTRNRIYSAMIQLTDGEANRLRELFETGRREQGRNGLIPANSALPTRGNCTSILTALPIGENGKTLGQIIGVGNNGSPHGLQKALEQRGNERVIAITVYGPELADFGTDKNKNHTFAPR